MKRYQKPELFLLPVACEDVLTGSDGFAYENSGTGDEIHVRDL